MRKLIILLIFIPLIPLACSNKNNPENTLPETDSLTKRKTKI